MCVSDGVSEVRKSAREQMRQGADQVKIMMSGGVASPYDPLDSLQFSVDEVAAAVEEAGAFGRYVCAHAYTPAAITRAAHAGVRTIEHGNLIDDASAKLMADKGMFLVANLVAYYAMRERAAEFGMSGEMLAKNDLVIDGGLRSLDICRQAGRSGGLWQRPARRAAGRPEPRVPAPPRGVVQPRDHSLGHHGRRAGDPNGRQVRHVATRWARMPTCWSSTATRWPTSAVFQDQGAHIRRDHEGRTVLHQPPALRSTPGMPVAYSPG